MAEPEMAQSVGIHEAIEEQPAPEKPRAHEPDNRKRSQVDCRNNNKKKAAKKQCSSNDNKNEKVATIFHTDYSKDDTMKEAVEEWDQIKNTKGAPTRNAFAKSKGINTKSFAQYAHNDNSKRKPIGGKKGRKSLVSDENTEFLIQHFIRADRANQGNAFASVIENTLELQPELTYKQASNFANRTFRAKSKGRLKPKPAVPQKTTSTIFHTDYSKDDTMKEAVEEWDQIKNTKGAPTRNAFAKSKGINTKSFAQYAHNDNSKRKPIGGKKGRKSLVSDENTEFLIQHSIRADRANQGNADASVIENILELQPELTYKQASNFANRTFRAKSKGRLKPKPVVPQKTTSKRSQITDGNNILPLEYTQGFTIEGEKRARMAKKKKEIKKLDGIFHEAVLMYVDRDTKKKKFTKNHINAILLSLYDVAVTNNTNKDDMLAKLDEQVKANKNVLDEAFAAARAATAQPPALPPLALPHLA